mgnify:CR=1 FL=1
MVERETWLANLAPEHSAWNLRGSTYVCTYVRMYMCVFFSSPFGGFSRKVDNCCSCCLFRLKRTFFFGQNERFLSKTGTSFAALACSLIEHTAQLHAAGMCPSMAAALWNFPPFHQKTELLGQVRSPGIIGEPEKFRIGGLWTFQWFDVPELPDSAVKCKKMVKAREVTVMASKSWFERMLNQKEQGDVKSLERY